MIVYVVEHGEQHEGGSVEGVYTTKKSAINAALSHRCCFEGGWTPLDNEPDTWGNGCDYIKVTKWKVIFR